MGAVRLIKPMGPAVESRGIEEEIVRDLLLHYGDTIFPLGIDLCCKKSQNSKWPLFLLNVSPFKLILVP